MLSQFIENIIQSREETKQESPKADQSIDEILGMNPEKRNTRSASKKVVEMVNNEAISNSSSPLENEKVLRKIETQMNKDKIDLPVELTEE